MSAAIQLPTWAVYMAAIGPAIGAFLGVLFAQLVTRKGAKELEKRSRREQTMKTLQWAAELAISDNSARAELGLSQLQALAASNLSDTDVQAFVDAALDAVVEDVAEEVEADPDAEIATPALPPHDLAGTARETPGSVQSEQGPTDGGKRGDQAGAGDQGSGQGGADDRGA